MMTEASDIYPDIAEKHGLTITQVKDSVIYFWRTGVKRSLESVVNSEIYITKLGSFKIKDYKLKYLIPQSKIVAQRHDEHERLKEYFTFLNTRLIEVDKYINSKKSKNKEFELNKSNPKDIREQASDMGGTEKQTNKE